MQQLEIISVRDVLESCIQREKLSIELYDRALEVVENRASRALVTKLRDEEAEHVRRLTSAMEYGRTDRLGKDDPAPRGTPRFPDEPLSLKANSTPREIFVYAIRHEEKSIDYFGRYVDAFRGTPLGELFFRLRREEEGHRANLLDELEKSEFKR